MLLSGEVLGAAPEIISCVPSAVVPGNETVLTFSGSNLETVSNLWSSFGGSARLVASSNSSVSFKVSCPPGSSGVQAVQLIGPGGASDFRLVLVDSLLAQANEGKNDSMGAALPLSPPVAIDSTLQSEKVDYYRLIAKAGQSYSLEAIAHRIGSRLDPVIRVLNSAGAEVAFCDDEPGNWRDARLRFTAPTDGEYFLAIHDVGYAGGPGFNYRLRVSNDPLVWYTYPLIDPSEPAVHFEQIGHGILELPPETSPANPPLPSVLSTLPAFIEAEPNNTANEAQPISFPAILHGKINRGEDFDVFKFTAAKDQKLVLQSQTRSLGSPCDLLLALKLQDGSIVARSNPNSAGDATLTNGIPETCEYFLEVRELSGMSDDTPYRIKLFAFEPGITLSTENNRLAAAPGKSATLKVSSVRYDFTGPVTLQLEPPLPLEGNLIPEGKTETELKITVPDDWNPGRAAHFKIFAQVGGGTKAVSVSTMPALRKTFPLMLQPPAHLDGTVSLTATAE